MIYKMYVVYDCKVEAYITPFFMRANGEAMRAFTELANDKSKSVGANPEDFTLFEVGTYDDSSAMINVLITPISLGKAIEFLKAS